MTKPGTSGPKRQAAIVFVLVTLGFDALGIGLVVPIVPRLVLQLSGEGASVASFAVGGLVATFALAQLIASPLLGGLSDRFGRRPVILMSLGGYTLNYFLLAWAPSLVWLFVGRLIAGSMAANTAASTAYIADVTPPEDRARRFGLIGATFSFGFVIGPALGGVLGGIDLRLPFLVAAAIGCCNVLFGLLALPESLPVERRQPFSWKGSNPVAALRMLRADPSLSHLALAWSCLWFGMGVLQTVFVLSTGLRFGWGTEQNGLALGLIGVCGAVVQGLLVRRVVATLGERRAAMTGFALSAASYCLLAFATHGWMVYAAVVVLAFGNIANPSVRALISQAAGPERQGRVMGALSAVEGLTAIVSPVVAALLFSRFAGPAAWLSLPGVPFLVGAMAYLGAILAIRRGIALSPKLIAKLAPSPP